MKMLLIKEICADRYSITTDRLNDYYCDLPAAVKMIEDFFDTTIDKSHEYEERMETIQDDIEKLDENLLQTKKAFDELKKEMRAESTKENAEKPRAINT